MKERIVQVQLDNARGGKGLDQQDRQKLPQGIHVPVGVGQEAVEGIVGMLPHRIGEGQDAGDGVSARTQDPPRDQRQKDLGAGGREHGEKLSDQSDPSRYSRCRIHTNLLVGCLSKHTSEGWYVSLDTTSTLPDQEVRKFTL
jgi:hypothetical protein